MKIRSLVLAFVGSLVLGCGSLVHAQSAANNFPILEESIKPIEQYVDSGVVSRGSGGIRDFIINTFYDVALPLIVGIGILMAILTIYALLFSDSPEDRTKTLKMVGRGMVGIILIMSARYITFLFLGETGTGGIMFDGSADKVSGLFVAQNIYDKIVMPFLRIGFILMIGVLFVVLLGRLISFLGSPSEDVKKKSMTIILRNALGILIIVGAKTIVETIYGKKAEIMNKNATKLSEIGGAALTDTSFPLLYTIINRVMGITSLVILIIIIFQAYQLLMNPEDESKLATVGKSFMYIAIGIVIIGLGYVITNVFLIQ